MKSKLSNVFMGRLTQRLRNAISDRKIDLYYDRIPGLLELRPHDQQKELWDSNARFKIVPAGRGSGKTELAKRMIVQALATPKEHPDPRYFYGAPTAKQAKRIAWNDIKRMTPKGWLASKDDIREGDMEIRTVFGSTLIIVGLDKPQRIEGVQWDGCVLDESSDIKPGTFDLSILPALVHRDGFCWRIGVPKRQGVGASEFKDVFERALAYKIPDTRAFHWPSSSVLSKDQLSYAMATMDARDYREQFEASFESAGGGVFYAFEKDVNVRPVAYDKDRPILVASDFNVDPMCWILCHVIDKQLMVFDELRRRDTNTIECLNILAGRYADHKKGWRFYGDATANQRITSASKTNLKLITSHPRFIKMGRTIHYPKANPPVVERIAATNALFLNAAGDVRLYVDPRCGFLIKDIEQRFYRPGSMVIQDTGDLGHMTDALGYVVHKLFPLRLQTATGSSTPVIAENEE